MNNLNNKDLFKEYLKLKRRYIALDKLLKNASVPKKQDLITLNSSTIDYLKSYYEYKIGPEFKSIDLMAEKIERSM